MRTAPTKGDHALRAAALCYPDFDPPGAGLRNTFLMAPPRPKVAIFPGPGLRDASAQARGLSQGIFHNAWIVR